MSGDFWEGHRNKYFNRTKAREAQALALLHAEQNNMKWCDKFDIAILETAKVCATFTTDHVMLRHPELERCPEKRVMGVSIRRMARDGLIEKTGMYKPSIRVVSHMRDKCEWRMV